jgi:hypothetical protein
MSHVSHVPLLDLLSENIMFLYGSLHQSDITYDLENGLMTLNGVNISYDETTIDNNIETINNLIQEYKTENEEEHINIITMLDDIQRVLLDAKDRLSWLQ